jgi:hypothetical protein
VVMTAGRPGRVGLRSRRVALLAVCAGALLLIAGASAEAKGLGRGRSGGPRAPRQPLGPTHTFKHPTSLERWTNSPKTDARRGLRQHSFWVRPDRGPRGGNQHLERKLNLDHPVKQREQARVPAGTRYHERPIRGGTSHAREVILHDWTRKADLMLKERVRK